MDKSSFPESPPPPKCAKGEMSPPNRPFQSILSDNWPHGMVLDMSMASHNPESAILFTVSLDIKTFSFTTRGIFSDEAILRYSMASRANSVELCSVFGQETFISKPTFEQKVQLFFQKRNKTACLFYAVILCFTDSHKRNEKGFCFSSANGHTSVAFFTPGPLRPTALRTTPLKNFTFIQSGKILWLKSVIQRHVAFTLIKRCRFLSMWRQ